MNRKKVVYLINSMAYGGAEHVFAKELKYLSAKGYSVVLCEMFKKPNMNDSLVFMDLLSEVRMINLELSNKISINWIFNLHNFINREKPDIVYSTLNEANILSRLIKIIHPEVKIIVREANVSIQKPLKFKFLDVFLNFLAWKVVCVSEDVRSSMLKYQPFHKKKFIIIPNGVELSSVKKTYAITHKKTLKLVSVGSLTKKKNHEMLVSVVSELNKTGVFSFELDIIGDGIEKEKLEVLIANFGQTQFIRLCGKKTSSEVKDMMLEADIFVLPSLFEGSPNVLLEAMSNGICCVSTRVSGAKEMLSNDSGILLKNNSAFDLSQELKMLYLEQIRMSKFGSFAYNKIVNEYSQEKHMEKIIKLFS